MTSSKPLSFTYHIPEESLDIAMKGLLAAYEVTSNKRERIKIFNALGSYILLLKREVGYKLKELVVDYNDEGTKSFAFTFAKKIKLETNDASQRNTEES